MDYLARVHQEFDNVGIVVAHADAVQWVHDAIQLQCTIATNGPRSRLRSQYNSWAEADLRIQSLPDEWAWDGILERALLLRHAFEFHLEHREAFSAHVRAEISEISQRTERNAGLEAFPADISTANHAESAVQADAFMEEAHFQWLTHPAVQFLAVERRNPWIDTGRYIKLHVNIHTFLVDDFFGWASRIRRGEQISLQSLHEFQRFARDMEQTINQIEARHGGAFLRQVPLLAEAVEYVRTHTVPRMEADCPITYERREFWWTKKRGSKTGAAQIMRTPTGWRAGIFRTAWFG
ncbi:hypothetical protein EJ03DRAFT_356179 [Teratosphaeria nubilosa]|uniref:Uncharacterized protein n=1 Tax=Teratosphaeria nubilosa TaxID=161662 RepID=A0A6G1KTN3_9PEZI|nr:hypothetical protein EJ03DRAFT_356179 [Teratosphaeria nubilosa]